MVKSNDKSQAGFTLVELAVVMIIIGLLIGGVLKGQELINNAQVTATVAKIKGYDAAVNTFKDMFGDMPGDMLNSTVRLTNCTNFCAANADGNGVLTEAPGVAQATAGMEALGFWTQLSAADLITGVNSNSPQAGGPQLGDELPEADLADGAAINVGFLGGGALATEQLGAVNPRRGHYYSIREAGGMGAAIAAGGANNSAPLSAAVAARVDRKLDDGFPNNGSVIGLGTAASCAGPAQNAIWLEAQTAEECSLIIRVSE